MKITTVFRFGIKTTAGLLLALGLTASLFPQQKLSAVAVDHPEKMN